jgi:SAM-dependent methyltransferase
MDLSERGSGGVSRHPWETSRAIAIRRILERIAFHRPRVLDVGCGDGYLVRELKRSMAFEYVVAQDIHLSDDLIRQLSGPGLRFVRDLAGLEYRADVLLLLDVLEHVEQPEPFLGALVRERLAPSGVVVITVPAFACLFTEHDRALRHFRRYSRVDLIRTVTGSGLEVLESGYLFTSLLAPRLFGALGAWLDRRFGRERTYGVGAWRAPAAVTWATHQVLTLDNTLCLAAQRLGIVLPGLSVWLTCRAQS